MCEPCTCNDCQTKSTLAALLWRDVWGANPDAVTAEDDSALDRILDALDARWHPECRPLEIAAALAGEIAEWKPRGALVQ